VGAVSNSTWSKPGAPSASREGRHLGGAGAGELLAHGRAGRLAGPVHPREHARAIGVGGGSRVDVHGGQPGYAGHLARRVGELQPQHLVEVRGGIRADEKDPTAAIGERDRRGAGDRGLPHATLAREEQASRRGR
jgi:hypothetical protein